MEEATTDSEGLFRLRGLAPGLQYIVSVKVGGGPGAAAAGSPAAGVVLPRQGNVSALEDRFGLTFMAIRKPVSCTSR